MQDTSNYRPRMRSVASFLAASVLPALEAAREAEERIFHGTKALARDKAAPPASKTTCTGHGKFEVGGRIFEVGGPNFEVGGSKFRGQGVEISRSEVQISRSGGRIFEVRGPNFEVGGSNIRGRGSKFRGRGVQISRSEVQISRSEGRIVGSWHGRRAAARGLGRLGGGLRRWRGRRSGGGLGLPEQQGGTIAR